MDVTNRSRVVLAVCALVGMLAVTAIPTVAQEGVDLEGASADVVRLPSLFARYADSPAPTLKTDAALTYALVARSARRSDPNDPIAIPSPTAVNPALLTGWSFLEGSPTARPTGLSTGASSRLTSREPVGPLTPQEEEVWTDPWGQEKNFGLAVVEAYLGNFLPWAFNELVPGRAALKISQISPRSWANNISHGWEWDDNAFQVNHFAHPFQGNIYYNAARTNGYGYWTGVLFATVGSYNWECCGETHFMSVNDWYNTAIGGAAVGEMLYRTSSMVLDNQATGTERAWRELGAFALNPVRGFTRLVSGNIARVYENPEHPSDHVPDRLENQMSFGVRQASSERSSGEVSVNEEGEAHGFFDLQMIYGSLLDLERQKPFDFFSLATQINLRQEVGLGKLQIRGNLWHKGLSRTENSVSKLILVQDFDYENNSAFEFGGQGVSMMYLKRTERSERTSFVWNAAATWMIMGGVNSEFSSFADIAGVRERLREYDFGTGFGGRVGFQFLRDGYRWIDGSYRVQHLFTLNGSNFNGRDASHVVQMFRLRGVFPLGFKSFGAGAEYELFLRDSFFEAGDFSKIEQRVPRWQIFLTWNPTRSASN
jgi:hypothetical protein